MKQEDLTIWYAAVLLAIGRAIPLFLALVAAGAVFRALGWWS